MIAGDWSAVGFRDGAGGRSDTHIAPRAEACAGLERRIDRILGGKATDEDRRPMGAYRDDPRRTGRTIRHRAGAAVYARL